MIYFLRHGLDDETYIGGWSDVDLVDEGVEQVREICSLLSKLPIKKIISSDINRAKTTSKIVSEYLNIPVEYSDKLRELDKGDLTGMDKSLAFTLYPEYMGELTVYDRFPNGESLMDLYDRVKILLEEIKEWNEVLIVTHRGVINMIYFIMENRLPDYDKKQFGVTHASVHGYDSGKRAIKKLGGK